MGLVAAVAFAGPAAAPALGGPISSALPAAEGEWQVTGTTSALSSHASPGSGLIELEQTGPVALRAKALSDVTLSGSDGSTCKVAGTGTTVAELTLNDDGSLTGPGLTGAVERYDDDQDLPAVRCTGSVSTTLSYTAVGTDSLLRVRPVFGAPVYSGMHYTLSFVRHPKVPYVALGDSYSSGEGAGNYDGKSRCHRSANAWPRLLAKLSQDRPLERQPHLEMKGLIACSGAETPEITTRSLFNEPPQLAELKRLKPRFVTISIGGNDAGFGATLQACFIPRGDCLSDRPRKSRGEGGPRPSKLDTALARIAQLKEKLVPLYGKITENLVDPERLVVVGYPDLIPNGPDRCGWLSEVEKGRLLRLSGKLENTLERATTKANVRYVSLRGTTSGHEMCSPKSWFVDITTRRVVTRLAAKLLRQHKLQELGHPRTPAQRAVAERVAEALFLR